MRVLPFLALVGCAGTSEFNVGDSCGTVTPVAMDDASLGFEADDVLALVSTALPTSVVWDQITAGVKSSDLAISLGGVADEVAILDEQGCYADASPPPALVVPLEASVSMAKGELSAEGLLTVAAYGVDSLDRVELRTWWELPATLTGEYEDGLTNEMESWSSDQVLDGVYVTGIGPWPEAGLDIEVQSHSDDAIGAEVLWRGHWTF